MNIVTAALSALNNNGNQSAISFNHGIFTYTQSVTAPPTELENSLEDRSENNMLLELKKQFNQETDNEEETLRQIKDQFDFDTEVEVLGDDLIRISSEAIFVNVIKSSGEIEDIEIDYNTVETLWDLLKMVYGDELDSLKNDVVIHFEGSIIQNYDQTLSGLNVFPSDSIKIGLKEFSNELYINFDDCMFSIPYKSSYTLNDLRTQIETLCKIHASEQILSIKGKDLPNKMSSKMTLSDHYIFGGETIDMQQKCLSSDTDIFVCDNENLNVKIKHYPTLTLAEIKEKLKDNNVKDLEKFHFVFDNMEMNDQKSLLDMGMFPGDTICLIKKDDKNPLILYDPSYMDKRADCIYPPAPYVRGYGKRRKVDFLNYEIPYGFTQKGIKSIGKFSSDDWLSDTGSWKVSYHGTKREFGSSISEKGYLLSKGERFAYGMGIYSTPEPGVAEQYASSFQHAGSWYKVIMMNRVNMETTNSVYVPGVGVYYITSKETDIRAFAILFKKVCNPISLARL